MSAEEEYVVPERKSVYVDFDGVIHSYVSGWVAPDQIPDPPVEGAIEWLTELASTYQAFIFTTRARYPEAHDAIVAWLAEHGFEGEVTITHEKGPAIFYLDDRAWRFRGNFPSMRQIAKSFPWRVGDGRQRPIREVISSSRATILKLEGKLRQRKQQLREFEDAARAVVDYYGVVEPMPEPLQRLSDLLGGK